jgi:hypothetical protein
VVRPPGAVLAPIIEPSRLMPASVPPDNTIMGIALSASLAIVTATLVRMASRQDALAAIPYIIAP